VQQHQADADHHDDRVYHLVVHDERCINDDEREIDDDDRLVHQQLDNERKEHHDEPVEYNQCGDDEFAHNKRVVNVDIDNQHQHDQHVDDDHVDGGCEFWDDGLAADDDRYLQ
jgi:hypothetical protein